MIRWFQGDAASQHPSGATDGFPSAGVCPARLPSRTPRGSAAGVLRPAGRRTSGFSFTRSFRRLGSGSVREGCTNGGETTEACSMLGHVRAAGSRSASAARFSRRSRSALCSVGRPNVARLVPAGELLSSVCLLALEEEACVG